MKNKFPTRRSARITKNNEDNTSFAEPSGSETTKTTPRGRKRKNSYPVVSPKLLKRLEKRKLDSCCWICHEMREDSISLICNSCPRTYHSDCMKKKHLNFDASGSCCECEAQSVSIGNNIPTIHRSSLRALLEFALQEALKENVKKNNQKSPSKESKFCQYFKTWPEKADNSSLCEIIDLTILIDKMKGDTPYLTTAKFFSDVKWIYHNCYILYGADSDITETALKLEKNFKAELLDLEACGECYFLKHSDDFQHLDSFTRVCKEPHDIVWAKLRGSPYWPAKCMRTYNGHADVRFFGSHDKATIQLSQCFRISQKSPNGRDIRQSKYLDAVRELSIYVSNYQNIHNSFPYYPVCTRLDLKVNSPKKPSNKRGRCRRSPSVKKQLPLSGDTAVASECDNTNEGDMPDTSTCDKPVEDVVTVTDESTNSTGVVEEETKNFQLPTAVSSHSSNNIETQCAPSEPVAVCMEFTEEADPCTQINMPSVSTVESSRPYSYTTPTNISPGTSAFVESTDGLNLCSETTSQSTNPPHFINSEVPGIFPVITSAVSEGMNPTFSSSEHVDFSSENSLPGVSEMMHNLSSLLMNPANMPNSENAFTSNLSNGQSNEFVGNCSSIIDDEDDDDVVVIKETPPKESKAVSKILKDSDMIHAFTQVLSSNKPHLQDLFNRCLEFGMEQFLRIWLATYVAKKDERELFVFIEIYKSALQANEDLKAENLTLKQEKGILMQEKETLMQENKILKTKNEILQGELRDIKLKKSNAERISAFMNVNVHKNSYETQLAALKSSNDCYLKQIDMLKAELCETENDSVKKASELTEYKEMVKILEDQLQFSHDKMDMSCKSVECQTSLSDLPDNQMVPLNEMQRFGKAKGQSSGESSEASQADRDSQVITKKRTTRTVTQSILEVVEDPLIPCGQQVFGNTSLILDYSLGTSSTLVTTTAPPTVVVYPDYITQQSNSTSKRNNRRRSSFQNRN